MGATINLRNDILEKVINGTDFTISGIYVSLHTADPGETGANEVTGGSYARKTGTWGTASNGEISITADIEFGDMPAVTVTHVGLFDASTAGNFLWSGALTASQTVDAGQTLRLQSGNLTARVE